MLYKKFLNMTFFISLILIAFGLPNTEAAPKGSYS